MDVTAGFGWNTSQGKIVASTVKVVFNFDYLQVDLMTNEFEMDFDLVIKDSDGDFATDGFIVTTFSEEPRFIAPITLDLNGDGAVQYLSFVDSPAAFDYSGDGTRQRTAWVGPEDGLLAYDANANRTVDDGSEIAFVGYHPDATTDLEGLALAFDTNKDGVFDAADAAYGSFGVWQDANSDGITDAGEFRTLEEAGITSINLSSDGVSATAADGQVLIHGSTSFSTADGSTGLAQDVEFAADPVLADASTPALDELATGITADGSSSLDISEAVSSFLTLEPVTEEQVAQYQQEIEAAPDEPMVEGAGVDDVAALDPAVEPAHVPDSFHNDYSDPASATDLHHDQPG